MSSFVVWASLLPLGPANPALRLMRGQELVYRGRHLEEIARPGVRFRREFALETRVWVLDRTLTHSEIALLTIVRLPPESGSSPGRVGSVQLERFHLSAEGKWSPEPPPPPLEGPPILETVLLGEGLLARGQDVWETMQADRPKTWHRQRTASEGMPVFVGLTHSADWDQPLAIHQQPQAVRPWQCTETLTLSPAGYAQQLERVIERREPGLNRPRSVTTWKLESALLYPERLSEDRRREITLALQWAEQLARLDSAPSTVTLNALAARMDLHLDRQPPTPYRDAVLALRQRVAGWQRGESPPPPVTQPARSPERPRLGQPAPDFAVDDPVARTSHRLSRWRGQPVVLAFYQPQGPTADDLLSRLHEVRTRYGNQVAVLALSVCDDLSVILAQRERLRLNVPTCPAAAVARTYGVDTTPVLVVIDAQGRLRWLSLGWGQEAPDALLEAISTLLPVR